MGKASSRAGFFGFFKIFFLAWRVLEGDQCGGEALRGRHCCAVLGESGCLEQARASKMSWKWRLFAGLVGPSQLSNCKRLNPTI